MTRYNTNLAAEFYVLSMLHRLGIDASLTLGNKKSVDIIVEQPRSRIRTLDVKGLADRYDWPADNIDLRAPASHFVALLCFEGKISDPHAAPNVWIIPVKNLKRFIKCYKNRKVVSRARIRELGDAYLDRWHVLATPPVSQTT